MIMANVILGWVIIVVGEILGLYGGWRGSARLDQGHAWRFVGAWIFFGTINAICLAVGLRMAF